MLIGDSSGENVSILGFGSLELLELKAVTHQPYKLIQAHIIAAGDELFFEVVDGFGLQRSYHLVDG